MISPFPRGAHSVAQPVNFVPKIPGLDCRLSLEKKIMCGLFAPAKTRGVLAKYAAHVTSASLGAVTDMDLKL